jgi:UrcA family protein
MNMFSYARVRILMGAFAALAAIAPMTGRAADTIAVQRKVSTAGLDLQSPEGVRALYGQLKSAARSLCSPEVPHLPAPSWTYRACEEDALAKVVRSQNRPLLTQAFIGDFGAEAAAHHGIDGATQLAKQ